MGTTGIAVVAAVATVIGAGLGALGAVVAARHTGRAQASTQFSHWRRQIRRDAYAAFIVAAEKERESLTVVTVKMRTRAAESDVHDSLTGLSTDGTAFNSSGAVVHVEGPGTLIEEVYRVQGARNRWFVALLHEAGHPLVDGVPPFHLSSDDAREMFSRQLIAFQRVARQVVDDPTGTLNPRPSGTLLEAMTPPGQTPDAGRPAVAD
ncbi:hypothetical protein [Streptomyces niveus]|uniref:hypothetical protein n=1 Tax=Streptomyces niveus TaxID=193462 RepID=UPI0036526C0C